jgi:protein-disulfide isomerase
MNFRSHARAVAAARAVESVDAWQEHTTIGARIGPESAQVTITVFYDYMCPSCRDAMTVIRDAVASTPGSTALVIRHFPLSNGLPRDAAIAAECSRRLGACETFHEVLVEQQDSLGLKSWVALAGEAGIKDRDTFSTCLSDSTAMAVVGADLRAAYRIGVEGTPAILVNDKFFQGTPPAPFLRTLIDDALRTQVIPNS